jgi:hypothetical protein
VLQARTKDTGYVKSLRLVSSLHFPRSNFIHIILILKEQVQRTRHRKFDGIFTACPRVK